MIGKETGIVQGPVYIKPESRIDSEEQRQAILAKLNERNRSNVLRTDATVTTTVEEEIAWQKQRQEADRAFRKQLGLEAVISDPGNAERLAMQEAEQQRRWQERASRRAEERAKLEPEACARIQFACGVA